MLGKFADVVAHDSIAHASGSSALAAAKVHVLRPDMNGDLSIKTTWKLPRHEIVPAKKQ